MASSFAAFSVAVLIWSVPGQGNVSERVPFKQVSPTTFSTLASCLDNLKQNITPREASAAHLVADAVQNSVHYSEPDTKLVAPRNVVRCLRVPVTGDVADALME